MLLSGYGGFNISRTPAFDPGNFRRCSTRGGVFALANLRGGGEYGEAWHRAGMLERKQNVFDDFIAAAEYLDRRGLHQPGRIAIEGGSNGGLLVGAVMVQRPDLFGAVLCRVPVADMLRYHLFTVGRFWIPEYGSADDPEQFAVPAALLPVPQRPRRRALSADAGDDRRHRRPRRAGHGEEVRRAAAGGAGGGPFLIRVETKAGHGAGKPVSKMIDEDADILEFLEQTIGWDDRG